VTLRLRATDRTGVRETWWRLGAKGKPQRVQRDRIRVLPRLAPRVEVWSVDLFGNAERPHR
jgi:hypothetical protein